MQAIGIRATSKEVFYNVLSSEEGNEPFALFLEPIVGAGDLTIEK